MLRYLVSGARVIHGEFPLRRDFAVRMNLMFKDAEVKCEVNSFRREEKKMNHNKHFSYWHKETDPDYSIAESLYRKLNEKDLYRK